MKKLLITLTSVFAIALVLFTGAEQAFAYTHTVTLKMGSRGAQVLSLQQTLNMTSCKVAATGRAGSPGFETMYYGPATAAAVRCFQTQHGLGVDAIVGPKTGAALAIITGGGTVGLPAGCMTTSGFSTTTGLPCSGTTSTVPGCLPGYIFSPTTGQRCDSSNTSGGALQGGAGDVIITTTSTDVEDTVAEGDDNTNVLGFKVEAEGSDISITSVKVTLMNCEVNCTSATANSSENLENYIDSVSIYMDDTKVGSTDVDNFNRDSGSPDEFSATINLSNAIIRQDKDAKFYVAVSAVNNIDTEDIDNADWNVDVDTVRYTDATGAILTADVSDIDDQTFNFEDASARDDIEIKSSSANPENATVKVDENDNSDEILALAFKLDVDNESDDVMITSLPIELSVSSGGTDADSIENIVDTVTVKVGSKSWDADLDDSSDTVSNGSGSATYTIDFDNDEFTIDSGDTQEVKVYITFNDQDGNYAENTVVTASVNPDDIDAETSNDEITVGGSTKTGADLTLNTTSADISDVRWSVNSTGTIVDLFFTVEAQDDDFTVLAAEIDDSATGPATVVDTSGTPETPTLGVLSRYSGDDVTSTSGGYTVASGDTVTFRVRYTLDGSNGQWKEITVDSIAGQDIPTDKERSPTATLNVNS